MLKLIIYLVNVFFFYYVFIYAIVFVISTISSLLELYEDKRKVKYLNKLSIQSKDNYVPVSILVPAYNEEATVADCIESLSNQDYPDYEIIVIDDGSSDNTSSVVVDRFKLNRVARPIRKLVKCKKEESIYEGLINDKIKITLVRKENGGKADPLNMGINISNIHCLYPLMQTQYYKKILWLIL